MNTSPDPQSDNATAEVRAEHDRVRVVGLINPGFRETEDVEVEKPAKVLGLKKPSNPQDMRNLMFAMFSLIIALVVFVVLEFKQVREAAREAKHKAASAARGAEHSLNDLMH